MTRTLLSSILLIITFFPSRSQDIEYAREIVNTLASPAFKGRGYVGRGDSIAAQYIANEFKRWGLKAAGESYFQPFAISANTFPGRMILKINGKKLTPGAGFLIEAGSPGGSGTFQTISLTAEDMFDRLLLAGMLNNSKGKFLIIKPYDKKAFSREQQKHISNVINFVKYSPQCPAAGVVVLTDSKLTWSGSTVQFPRPVFIIKNESIRGPIKKISMEIDQKFMKKYVTQNVIGYIEGRRSDSTVVLTAHYDHLGMMGEGVLFPGANDNASGVAMLLNLAKYFSEHKPKFNTFFIAFGAEEMGLLGAKYFVKNPVFDMKKIRFLLNFDLAGTGDDGIQVVNGSVYKKAFDRLVQLNENQALLQQVKIRGAACNSDHCPFHENGVPCFFIYTLGGIRAYHDIYDKAETLPLTEFEDYFTLIIKFLEGL